MKKYLVIASILLLAVSCGKKTQQPVPQQSQASQPSQNQQTATSSPAATPTSTTPTSAKPSNHAPLTMSVYTDPAGKFSIRYTSNFIIATQAMLAGKDQSENVSACNLGLGTLSACFVLKGTPYKSTNLSSAAVYVRKLPNLDIGQCAQFDQAELAGGRQGQTIIINGVPFLTAQVSDAGAGNLYETHYNRAYYNDSCYEVDETIHSTNAQNYSPPRQEFDKTAVWAALDSIRGGYNFIAPASSKNPSIILP